MKVVLQKPEQTTDGQPASKGRPKSAIGYPYFDLDASIKVAEAIHMQGGGACSPDQLAHWLGYKSTRSGTYLTRVAAAKQFGLIEGSGDRLTVADRALAILAPVMPSDAIRSRVEAFLNVELFDRVYNDFRGKTLPSEGGLSNLFQNTYKIVPDRVPAAVRVFLASARQAEFLVGAGDNTRLIQPSGAATSALNQEQAKDAEKPKETPDTPDKPKQPSGGTGGGDGPTGVHSAIIGLLRDLPPAGTVWPAAKKARFLTAFQATIDFVYPQEGDE